MAEPAGNSTEPTRLGGFELISKIAEGGMGAVYRAKQVSLDRTVAVKILPEKLAKDGQFVARFLREAKLAAQFSHPNIVGAVDAGEIDGVNYFAMEYVEGESLGQTLLREKAVPEPRAIEIVSQIARALECAHKHDMVHRDVKPDNILIDEEGTAKLADLGLARQVSDDSTQLTQAGTAMGSPHYIAPEQARGEPDIDIRADIYALGATFHHVVTGATPFTGQTAAVIMTRHLNDVPLPANKVLPSVSEATSRVIVKMMAKDRDSRYQTPTALLADLERLARGDVPAAEMQDVEATFLMSAADLPERRRRSRWKPVLAVAGTVAVIVAAVVFLVSGKGAGDAAELGRIEGLLEAGKLDVKKLQEAKGALDALLSEGSLSPKVGEQAKELAKELKWRLTLALKEREAEAAAELEAVEGLIAGGKLDVRKLHDAIERAWAGAERFAEERPRFEELASRAAKLLKGKKESEAARAKAEALFLEEKRRGEKAEAAGKLEDAIASYEKAIRLGSPGAKPDPALAAHVEEIRRATRSLKKLAKKIALADELERKGDLAGARRELEAALESATAKDRDSVSQRLEALALLVRNREKAFDRAVTEAKAHLDARRLDLCVASAKEALELKPADAVAKRLIIAAERTMVVRNSIGMELVYLPGGEFTMGGAPGDPDERPPHRVRLSHFYISKTEVTNAQYEKFKPRHFSQRKYSEGEDSPVVRVSWHEAKEFCALLSIKEGVRYSLPTEAQWEYAATGAGAGTPYPWGAAAPAAARPPGGRCNIGWGERGKWDSDGHEFAAPVGSFPKGAGPQGVVDLIGNVWEWCSDWYSAEYYGTEAARGEDPLGPATGKEKVLRGGSFIDPPDGCRSRYRSKKRPDAKAANFGFRIVRKAR